MRSFATVAAAAAVLSTASAFAPQAQRSPLSAAVSAPVTSNVVLNQAAEEVDPLDFTPEVRHICGRGVALCCWLGYDMDVSLHVANASLEYVLIVHFDSPNEFSCDFANTRRAPKSASRLWSMPIPSFSS